MTARRAGATIRRGRLVELAEEVAEEGGADEAWEGYLSLVRLSLVVPNGNSTQHHLICILCSKSLWLPSLRYGG